MAAAGASREKTGELGRPTVFRMDDPDIQTGYWDRVAEEKSFTHPLDPALFSPLVPKIAKILDYGCGYGRLGAVLLRAGFNNVTGVDVSAAMIARGKRENPGLDLRVAGPPPLPFPAASFDLALLFAVLTTVATDSGQLALMAEIERVLAPGGLILVSDYPLQTDEKNLARYAENEAEFGRYGIFRLPGGGVMRHHDEKWLSGLFSGFTKISREDFLVRTMNGSAARAFRFFGKKRPRP